MSITKILGKRNGETFVYAVRPSVNSAILSVMRWIRSEEYMHEFAQIKPESTIVRPKLNVFKLVTLKQKLGYMTSADAARSHAREAQALAAMVPDDMGYAVVRSRCDELAEYTELLKLNGE